MIEGFRKALLALTARAQQHETATAARRLRAMAVSLLRSPSRIKENLEGFAATATLHKVETSSWVPHEHISAGNGGPFDACDLRVWIALASAAGVPTVPAREILHLTEDEMDLLSGSVSLPDDRVTRGMRRRAAEVAAELGLGDEEPETGRRPIDVDELVERLFAAMDNVPEGWMVRSARCGSIELKALAGAGVAGPSAPEVRFGPNLEIGPGWIREGNRRRVHVSDNRTIQSAAEGPEGGSYFLARPWVEAARFFAGEDPHRHGTPFAGKGYWPAEWRAFVEDGEVVGVSAYYGWCSDVSPENARMALQVREEAAKIVSKACEIGAYPRYMDVEFARSSRHPHITGNKAIQSALETFGREKVSCTIDFIEVKGEGLMMLEAGPANTPFGGGHPCAFAGCGGQPKLGNKTHTIGVAFRMMDHVSMADPATWTDGDHAGRILEWGEVEALALT